MIPKEQADRLGMCVMHVAQATYIGKLSTPDVAAAIGGIDDVLTLSPSWRPKRSNRMDWTEFSDPMVLNKGLLYLVSAQICLSADGRVGGLDTFLTLVEKARECLVEWLDRVSKDA